MELIPLYSKILVINLMHIGDLLLVTPVLRALRTEYPQAHLALVADAKLADLVKYNQNIDELIALDKKGHHNKLRNYLGAVKDIRCKHFDLVVNLHQNERASFLAAFSGAPKIVGYSTFGLHWLFDGFMKNRKAIKHQVESHFDVLRDFVGVTYTEDHGIEMWLDPDAEQQAQGIWAKEFSPSVQVIGLNIGASWPTKRWRGEYYAELGDRLLDMGYGLAFFGGPMDTEIVQQTISMMRQPQHPLLKVFTGKVSLLVLAALLKKCAVLVTNDSGPMHIAVAMDVPLVTMFGSSPVPGFYPYNNKSILIQSPVDCHPCGIHQCPDRNHECMRVITVDIVLHYTMKLIRQYGNRQGDLPRDIGQYQCEIIEL